MKAKSSDKSGANMGTISFLKNRFSIPVMIGISLAGILGYCAHQGQGIDIENATDPKWIIQESPKPKVALVFIHGIYGDTVETWGGQGVNNFFEYLKNNKKLKGNLDMFAFGFTSKMFGPGSLSIGEAANKLQEALQYHGIFEYPAIVLVTHSMGGLVAMQYIIDHPEHAARFPLLMLYATPQEGAQISVIANKIAKNSTLEQLFPADKNEYIRQLDSSWRRLEKRPYVVCGYEKLPTKGIMVVPWASATRFCSKPAFAIEGATHETIVKPDRNEHDSIVLLVNALNEHVLEKNFEAKLELPDFPFEGERLTFKMDSRQRKARLVNSGVLPLNYSVNEVSDSALYIVSEKGEIEGRGEVSLVLNLLWGALPGEYTFVIESDVPSKNKVAVRFPDLEALAKARERALNATVDSLSKHLNEEDNAKKLSKLEDRAAANKKVVEIVHESVVAQSPGLPSDANWLLTADTLMAMNWPELAISAMQQVEKYSVETAKNQSAQRLAGIISEWTGERNVFSFSESPRIKLPAQAFARRWSSEDERNRVLELAAQLKDIPSLKVLGLSLESDVLRSKGDLSGARYSLVQASQQQKVLSIEKRIEDIDRSRTRFASACYMTCISTESCRIQDAAGNIQTVQKLKYSPKCGDYFLVGGRIEGFRNNSSRTRFVSETLGQYLIEESGDYRYSDPPGFNEIPCISDDVPCGKVLPSTVEKFLKERDLMGRLVYAGADYTALYEYRRYSRNLRRESDEKNEIKFGSKYYILLPNKKAEFSTIGHHDYDLYLYRIERKKDGFISDALVTAKAMHEHNLYWDMKMMFGNE